MKSLLGVILLCVGSLLFYTAVPAGFVYFVYLAGPQELALGMAMWKGLVVTGCLFVGGLVSAVVGAGLN